MKKQVTKAAGLLCYLIIISLLFDFNWIVLFKPRPFLSVLLGMAVLTASQYRKEYTRADIYAALKWNLLFGIVFDNSAEYGKNAHADAFAMEVCSIIFPLYCSAFLKPLFQIRI